MKKRVTVKNGIDPRNIASLVQLSSTFKSHVKIQYGTKVANAKSIMGIISLQIVDTTDIAVIVEGQDEAIAIEEICEFLSKI